MLCVGNHLNHFRDDIAAPLDAHRVADEQAEALDLVGIMQRCPRDRDTPNDHRSEPRHGRELARAAHLDPDVLDARDRKARRELVGDRPARSFAGIAEAALECGVIQLDDHPVNLVTETATIFLSPGDELHQAFDASDCLAVWIHAKSGGGERVKCRALLRKQACTPGIKREVRVEVQSARRDDVRLQRPDRSSRRVSRVCCRS